jgi:AcrR family transcriptional regulator
MGTKERRDRERQELRLAILAAARDIAASEGWQSVTIRKVAERIEYSPPTIYEHFDGKDALLHELMRAGYRLLLEEIGAATECIADPAARLMVLAEAYWRFAWANPELYQVMHGLGGVPFCAGEAGDEAGKPPPEAQAVFDIAATALASLADSAMSCDDIDAAVHILWSTLHGLVSLTMAGRIDGGAERGAALVEQAARDFLAVRKRSLAS